MKITLYRGISTVRDEKEIIMGDICRNGIQSEPVTIRYIGLRHDKLRPVDKIDISKLSLRDPSGSWTFACGDPEGASFYASRNQGRTPILLRLSVDVNVVHVDGRDALFTAFGRCHLGDGPLK